MYLPGDSIDGKFLKINPPTVKKTLPNMKGTRLHFLGHWTRQLPIFAFVCFISITLFIQTLFIIRGVGHRIIYSDGAGYYAWARSIVYDHDLDFKNDFEILYPPDEPPLQPEKTKANKHMNKYPPAMGVLELPAILVGHIAAIITNYKADGRSLPFQFSAAIYLTLLNSLGLFFLYKLLMQEGFAPIWALAITGTVLCCSNLIHYMIKEPSLVHGVGFCGISISLWWFSRLDREFDFRQTMLIGAVMGLFLSLRYTNIALLPIFGVIFLSHPKKSLSAALGLTTGGLIIMSTLAALSWLHRGELALGYPNERFTGGLTGLISTLFSQRHGLFIYHPIYLILFLTTVIAILKFIMIIRSLAVSLSFALLWLANGSWWCWWFGDSFGNRAFIESLPLLVFGAAPILLRVQNRYPVKFAFFCASAVILLGLMNLSYWSGYLLHRFSKQGDHTWSQAVLWWMQ